ncbi:hypothetical protein K3495_g10745 [Podosphaera aphanis]|nr:hypothetical protein K3495_g10745 [Podosphaera aphanis]
MLLTTALLTTYATYVGISLLSDIIRYEVPAWNLRGKGYLWTQYGSLLAWALNKQMRIGAITLLCLLTCPLVWGLLSYHSYLIWAGTTTNETMKWSDLGADMSDGFAFKRTLPNGRVKDVRFEPLWTRWPVESDHVISRSYDGRPPRADIIGSGEWQRVWKLADIQNLYDLGLKYNFRDIFWPEYSSKNLSHTSRSSLRHIFSHSSGTSNENLQILNFRASPSRKD